MKLLTTKLCLCIATIMCALFTSHAHAERGGFLFVTFKGEQTPVSALRNNSAWIIV